MALSINLCNDIDKYEESVVGGFGARKLIHILIAVFVGAGTVSFFYFICKINLIFDVYIMIIPVAPIIFNGFYSKDGLTFYQVMKKRFIQSRQKPLLYHSTECVSVVTASDIVTLTQDSENRGRKETAAVMRKLKLVIIASVFAVILLVILILLLL